MLDYDAIYDDIEERFKKAYSRDGFSKAYFIKPGHSEEEIDKLEETIGVKLSDDYRQFIKKYKEVEGDDLYVVYDLKKYADYIFRIRESREEINAPIPDNMYLLGEFDLECPIYLQDIKGRVYEFRWDYKYSKPKKIANSFIEFMNKQIEFYNNLPIDE